MSGGKSSSSTSSPYAGVLASIAEQINKETDPLRTQFLSQLSQVLSGNTSTSSTIPLIQSGVASARQAGASSISSAQGYLAQSGVARSPFAAAIMSLTNQANTANIGNVPLQVANTMLGETSTAASGFTNSSLSGLASAIQGNMQQSGSNLGFNASDILPSNW